MSRYEYPNMYYAYNETFVDDEGLPCFRRNTQQPQQQQQQQQQQKQLQQQQHQQHQQQKQQYAELSCSRNADEGETEFFLDDDDDDEEYLYDDQTETRYYDEKLDYLNLSVRHVRDSPIGEGSRINRYSESSSSTATATSQHHQQQAPLPKAVHGTRHRSSSVPRRGKSHNVLAPMVAQAERQHTLRRSHSTIIQSNRDRARMAAAASLASSPDQMVRDPRRPFQQFQVARPAPRLQRHTSTPTRLKSYSHLIPSSTETSLIQLPPSQPQPRTTAVISPNYRSTRDAQCALPLLAGSPTKLRLVSNSPNKSNSWMNLSNQRLPSEPLWFAGIILLLTGGITCMLCLYILSKSGRKYYLDFGAISGFVCLILGLVGCRTARWLPHRHYVTGYILLSAFSLLECGILAILASDSNQLDNNIIDIAGGAICGLSALCILLATLGFLTSACCNLLPPDSRIGHSAPGFRI